MSRYKQEAKQKYINKTKNMSAEDKSNYDLLLTLQDSFDHLVNKLHTALFPEEYDFIYDEIADSQQRQKGENPMHQDYIEKANAKRVKLGFLPLTQNGYAQDGDATKIYCKKLITRELEYKNIDIK